MAGSVLCLIASLASIATSVILVVVFGVMFVRPYLITSSLSQSLCTVVSVSEEKCFAIHANVTSRNSPNNFTSASLVFDWYAASSDNTVKFSLDLTFYRFIN